MTWHKTSRHARNYGTAWEKVRAIVLERDGHLCQCAHCKAEKRTTLATEVHHLTSRAKATAMGWTLAQADHPSNLASMAHDCHVRADAEAQGKVLSTKVGFDRDGRPLDVSHPWRRK